MECDQSYKIQWKLEQCHIKSLRHRDERSADRMAKATAKKNIKCMHENKAWYRNGMNVRYENTGDAINQIHGLHTDAREPDVCTGGRLRGRDDDFDGVVGRKRDGSISARLMNCMGVRGEEPFREGDADRIDRGLWLLGLDKAKEGINGTIGSGVFGRGGISVASVPGSGCSNKVAELIHFSSLPPYLEGD